jgi:hypothetical protein
MKTQPKTIEQFALHAWNDYSKENYEKLDNLDDETFFLVGEAFVEGWMIAFGEKFK